MSVDSNWQRWLHASIVTYFTNYMKDNKGGKGLPLQIEGQDRTVTGKEDYVQLSWDGPDCREVSKNYWHLDVDINLLVSSVVNRDDTYAHKRIVGLAQAAFVTDIPVFKYGNNTETDDNSLLGCLQLRTENREVISTDYFGKIEADVSLEQSTVRASYRMILSL